MSLYTGKQLHSYNWQELPIDDETINRVEDLAKAEKAKQLSDKYPAFEWVPGISIIDELIPLLGEAENMNNDDKIDQDLPLRAIDNNNDDSNPAADDNFVAIDDVDNDAIIVSEDDETNVDQDED